MTGQQLKNSILQEAIEGRLVSQDPNDEPASVLLERIRAEKARLVKEKKIKKDKNESRIYRTGDGHWMEHFEDKNREDVCIDEEIPFDLPNGWEWCRLDFLADIVRGGSPRPAGSPEYYGGKIPFLKVADLTKDNKMYVNSYTTTIKEAGLKKTREVDANTLLLTNSGATLGVPKICTFKTTFNDGIAAFLYLSNQIKPYIYWFLCSKTESFRKINQGTAQPNLNTDIIRLTLLALPPLAEQHRIVEKIESLLPKVEAYGKAQEELEKLNEALPEQLKRSILQEAIEGRLVPQDPNDEPASALLEHIRAEKARLVKEKKIKKDKNESRIYRTEDGDWMEHFEDKNREDVCIDEEIPFDLPNGWEWCRFGGIVNTYTGKTPARGESKYWSNAIYPWFSISDMILEKEVLKTKECISEIAAKDCFGNSISPKGTLIMSFKLTVGRTSILGLDAYHNEAIISIETLCDKDNYFRNYLLYILPIITTLGDTKNAIKGKTLNATSIYKLLVPLPPLAEQHRIVEKLEEILPKLNNLKKETEK